MPWSRKQHEAELTDAIIAQDLNKVQQLADAAVKHDRDVAAQTGEIVWAHKDKWPA